MTPNIFPTSPCVSLSSSLFFNIRSPRVCGSKSKGCFLKELRHTWTNGKKATRLCPCGYHGHYNGKCHCTPDQISRYRSKISGPLLDRIDIQIEVPAVPQDDLLGKANGEGSSVLQNRVESARQRQLVRQNKSNALLSVTEIDELCKPDAQGEALLQQAISRLNLSARAYHRVLKVARTIADWEGAQGVDSKHIAEAVQYRRLNF